MFFERKRGTIITTTDKTHPGSGEILEFPTCAPFSPRARLVYKTLRLRKLRLSGKKRIFRETLETPHTAEGAARDAPRHVGNARHCKGGRRATEPEKGGREQTSPRAPKVRNLSGGPFRRHSPA